jgi:Zn-dependent peptidase ImmA (M78 family)
MVLTTWGSMQQYRKVVNILKKHFSEYKLTVRRLPLPDTLFGDCKLINKKKKEFLIRINKDLDEDQAIFIFLHEISHCEAWFHPGDDHGLAWGKAYSKVYRAYLKYYINESDMFVKVN